MYGKHAAMRQFLIEFRKSLEKFALIKNVHFSGQNAILRDKKIKC